MDGRVQIAALKGDLTINDDTGTTTLAQGQQTTREESQSQDDSQSQKDNNKKNKRQSSWTRSCAPQGGSSALLWQLELAGELFRCDNLGVNPER